MLQRYSPPPKRHRMLSPPTIKQTFPGRAACVLPKSPVDNLGQLGMKSCIKLRAWVSRRLVFGHGEDSEPQQKDKLQTASNLPPSQRRQANSEERGRISSLPHISCTKPHSFSYFISFLPWFSDHIHPSAPHFVHFTLSSGLHAEHDNTWTIRITWHKSLLLLLGNSSQAGECAPLFSISSVLKSDLPCKKQALL